MPKLIAVSLSEKLKFLLWSAMGATERSDFFCQDTTNIQLKDSRSILLLMDLAK